LHNLKLSLTIFFLNRIGLFWYFQKTEKIKINPIARSSESSSLDILEFPRQPKLFPSIFYKLLDPKSFLRIKEEKNTKKMI
jgi:hypothetical protein